MSFFSSEEIELLRSSRVYFDVLCELQFASGTLYVWNGHNEIPSGGKTWQPLHGLADISDLDIAQVQESANIQIGLSGLPDDGFLAKALEQTQDVNQQNCIIYAQFFKENWQPFGDPNGMFHGFMQPPKISRSPMDEDQGSIQSVTIDVENLFFNRSKPPYGRLTDTDQKKRSSGDRFLEFTSGLVNKLFVYPDF